MTDQAPYQPLPMPHGRVRPTPPPLLVQQGTLPPDLVEQARARQTQAEVLVLPREAEAHIQDGDPSLAIYNDSDMVDVEVLRRGGVRADYLAEHRKVISQFAAVEWIDFAVAVAEGVSAAGVVGIAKYLAGRIHKARQSGAGRAGAAPGQPAQLQLDVTLVKLPDGTFLRSVGTDTEAVSKPIYAGLAAITSDPEARCSSHEGC